jgi:hypothetical protein
VRQPSVAAARAPRLDRWRFAVKADDARTTVRAARRGHVDGARRGGGRVPLCGGSGGSVSGMPEDELCVPVAPAPTLAVAACRALHSCLWPPSFQSIFWHSTEQYHTCERSRTKRGRQCMSVRGKHPRDVRTHQSEHIFLVNFRHCTHKLGTHLLARTAPLLAVLLAIVACTAHAMSAFACCAVPTATAIAAVCIGIARGSRRELCNY